MFYNKSWMMGKVLLHASRHVFGGTSCLFSFSYWANVHECPFLHEISPLCPDFWIPWLILFSCVPPCRAKFNFVSRFYHCSFGMYAISTLERVLWNVIKCL